MSSSSPPSSRLSGDDTGVTSASTVSTEANPASPPTTTTATTFIPLSQSHDPTPSSSSSPSPSPLPQQPGAFFTGGASPPLIAGFISIGALAVAIVSICAWCKFRRRGVVGPPDSALTRFVDRVLPAGRRRLAGQFGEGEEGQGQEGQEEQHAHRRGRRRWTRGRGRGRSDELSKAKPEMFDAWIEKGGRSVDSTSKWEAAESVPLSATLFATAPRGPGPGPGPEPGETAAFMGMAEVSSRAGGGDSVEEKDEEKRGLAVQQMRQAATGSSSTLQVAVFLQMPSPPPPSHTVTEAPQNDTGVRGELAIGFVEAPWTREHPSSREGKETANILAIQ